MSIDDNYKIINALVDSKTGALIIRPSDNKVLCYLLKEGGIKTMGYVPKEKFIEATSRDSTEGEKEEEEVIEGEYNETRRSTFEEESSDSQEDENQKDENQNLHAEKQGSISKEFAKTSGPWTDDETKLLMEVYPEVAETTKDNLSPEFWKKVSGLMANNGLQKTWISCKEKWKSLTRTYKINLKKKKDTGKGPVTWPYFDEMHKILYHKPEINPVSTASSIAGYKKRIRKEIETEDEEASSAPKAKKIKSKPEWVEEMRRDAASRHKENLECKQKFLSTFEEYIKLLKKK